MDPESLKSLSSLPLDLDSIGDPDSRSSVVFLTNLIEDTVKEIQQLKEENQLLRDEISRLKGEQGRPKIRPQKKDGNISSESERNKNNEPKPKKSKEKKSKIIAHDEKICRVDKIDLPSDAEFKGYETLVIQDIIIKAHNTAFKREVYYSPSLKKRFIGDLPPGYESEFGPEIKTLILCLCHDSGMSQPNIHRFLKTIGIHISPATISRTLTDNQSVFHEEKAAIVNAALRSSSYQHIDDTGARVNGKNYCCHVLCNPFYTAYFCQTTIINYHFATIINCHPGHKHRYCL